MTVTVQATPKATEDESPIPIACSPVCGKKVKPARGKTGVLDPAGVLENLGMCYDCWKIQNKKQECVE